MNVEYIIIIVLLVVAIIVLLLKIRNIKKHQFSEYENKLMLFVLDMYLSYGDSLDIFPNDDSKEVLINKIKNLKIKIIEHNERNKKSG